MITSHEVLVNMRNTLAKGWIKNELQIGDRYCMIGAATRELRATGTLFDDEMYLYETFAPTKEAVEILAGLITRKGSDTTHTVTEWNDRARRRKSHVLALLDKAIAQTAPLPEDLELVLEEEVVDAKELVLV